MHNNNGKDHNYGNEDPEGLPLAEIYLLCAMKPQDAKKAASETSDVALLEACLKDEDRSEVKKAIEAQVKAIKAPTVLRDSKKSK